jgi:hypothetical protein
MSSAEESAKEGSFPVTTKKRKFFAFPGEQQGIIAAPHYIGDKVHLNANGPRGGPGLYTVTFVLARPNSRSSPEHEIKFAADLHGDSHLAIAKPAVIIDIDPDQVLMSYRSSTGSLLFRGYPNKDGYLGKLVSDPFFAANRGAAEKTATTAIRGLLSNLSSQLDIPLIIEIVEVTEISTQAKGISFAAPFPPTSMAVTGSGTFDDPEFQHAVALYREAINSNTQIYRFLCFYKVLELSRKRRERLGRKHKASFKQPRPGEQIPLREKKAMEEWLNALFYVNRDWDEGIFDQVFIPEALGKKINNLFESQLRPIRDKIAHGILDSGEFLLLDKQEDIELVGKWLPLMRCLARRVMKNDFKEYLEFLNEDGTVIDISKLSHDQKSSVAEESPTVPTGPTLSPNSPTPQSSSDRE